MRKAMWGAVSILLLAGALSYGAPQQESVAEAARKARQQKKAQPKPGKVITNDDLPATSEGISVVGTPEVASAEKARTEAVTEAGGKKAGPPGAKAAEEEEVKGEAYWRKRFAEARRKLRDAERELDILQRELNLKELQYYPDPTKALREQYDRKEINSYRQKITDKQREVDQLRQALSDLEDELRRAGGDPGWAREP
ncbi:MAG TPA: hypothetical protein VKE24_01400 [Candidatus Acidoferrales bacterium]|nr:hypothetical protein [Candidatus Acidoferrales bacterium]